MARLFDLAGRTALVTGSSRGLGRAMAQELAETGAALVLNGADAEFLPSRASGELNGQFVSIDGGMLAVP